MHGVTPTIMVPPNTLPFYRELSWPAGWTSSAHASSSHQWLPLASVCCHTERTVEVWKMQQQEENWKCAMICYNLSCQIYIPCFCDGFSSVRNKVSHLQLWNFVISFTWWPNTTCGIWCDTRSLQHALIKAVYKKCWYRLVLNISQTVVARRLQLKFCSS